MSRRDRDELERLGIRRGTDVDVVRRMQVATGKGGTMIPVPSVSVPQGPLAPVKEPIPGNAPYVRLLYPPRIEKIPASVDFRGQDYVMAVPAGVGSFVTSTAAAFRLPQDHVGWLQQTRIYILSPLGTTRLRWTFRINQGPIPGFDAVENPPGVANFELIIENDMRVRVPNGALVDVLITNLDGGAITAGALLAGWYHPRTDEIRYFGSEV